MPRPEVTLTSDRLVVTVALDDQPGPRRLADQRTGFVAADLPYGYDLVVRRGGRRFVATRTTVRDAATWRTAEGAQVCEWAGLADFGARAAPALEVRQMLTLSADGAALDERVSLVNRGRAPLELERVACGFRRRVSRRDASALRAVAVPFRRDVAGGLHDYAAGQVIRGEVQNADWGRERRAGLHPPEFADDGGVGRSEAWLLTEGGRGLLVAKYNQEMIEYSMLRGGGEDGLEWLGFGGVGRSLYGEPTLAARLGPGERLDFGLTRYVPVEGGWEAACGAFKAFLNERGHGLPQWYDPPVHWNELYDIGWYHSDPDLLRQHYTREALRREAAKARECGCELLYLDPGWEVCEGTTLWGADRLGEVREFVAEMGRDYGLAVGFRTIGRTYRDEWPRAWHIQRSPEQPLDERGPDDDGGPERRWWSPCTCCRDWWQEKLRRILALCDAGMRFIMFDEFDWRGPCFDPGHGHRVPTTPDDHVRAVYGLIEAVHARHPDILIEAHDPVWPWHQRYLPVYYRHGLRGAYDENWGFEFMWNPIADLRSGKALALHDYNLATDIPLYVHITMEGDNDRCLTFWWTASTVRHLGIGGKKGLSATTENEARYRAYLDAMRLYRRLKPLFTRGAFVGLDELTHLHVLPGRAWGVLTAFNVGAMPAERTVALDTGGLGIGPAASVRVEGAPSQVRGDRLEVALALPAEGPCVVELRGPGWRG